MLSFLLDEQISPKIARQINLQYSEIEIVSIHDWQDGIYLGIDDETILQAAATEFLTLVTYDQNTIPPVLVEWGEAAKSHTGVIFIDYRSFPPSNFGRLIKAIVWLWQAENTRDWKNRIVYLQLPKID